MLVSPDSTPPTASFSPADEATGVAIDANALAAAAAPLQDIPVGIQVPVEIGLLCTLAGV